MPTNRTKTIDPQTLQADKDAVTAILAMADYSSQKADFDKSVMYAKNNNVETGLKVELTKAEEDVILKEQALSAARDRLVTVQWQHHDWVLGARDQVAAKFGKNSDQFASTGLKKKSEYKKPSGKAKTAAAKPGA